MQHVPSGLAQNGPAPRADGDMTRPGRAAPAGYHDLPPYRLYATIAGLMVSILLAALDQTIVGTAMPRIVSELHGQGVKVVVALTHLSTRYFGHEVVQEARELFPDTVVPRDFDVIEIPFPERGTPELVRSGARRERTAVVSEES